MTTSLPEPDGDTIAGDPRLIDVESTFESEHDSSEPRPGLSDRIRASFERSGDEVVGGVGSEIASALGIDALWVRLAFVVLALVGGVGVLLYAGLWLALIVGTERPWARRTGGVLVIVGVPLYISGARVTLATGTGAVIVLLVGMALALWNRDTSEVEHRERATAPPADPDATIEHPVVVANSVADPVQERRAKRLRSVRDRPPPSPLGRATLGAAVVVAAAGALIDEINGGRLHPEQWLGAAAIVCGVGLLVGTARGRGRWLIVPAAAFTVAGFVGGGLAQAGVPIEKLGSDSFTYIREGEVTSRFEPRAAFGATYIDIEGDPGPEVVEVDTRAFSGDVNLTVSDAVTVMVRTDIDDGSSFVDGRSEDGMFTVGPDGAPDVIIDARVVRGDVRVDTYDAELRNAEVPAVPVPGEPEYFLADGVMLRDDGFVFLGEGEVIIDPDNTPIAGNFYSNGSEYQLETAFGSWRLLDNLLITPTNDLIDLDVARLDAGIGSLVAPVDPANPVEMVPPAAEPLATTTVPVTVPPSTTPPPAPDNGQEG
ncbi:MAG: PspC domain-containing protein [Ilumatobacter sp.]|uniref:PspC domain-containing protein n=1 Tax=Ilumatobacter sp. TaxID=1967498 RepID=UPI003C736FBE